MSRHNIKIQSRTSSTCVKMTQQLAETWVLQSADKELVMLPDMWHVLIKEPGNERVIDRMEEWLLQRA